jgi:hypothetical protein
VHAVRFTSTQVLRHLVAAAATWGILVWAGHALAADIQASPSDYRSKVSALQPGDTLRLAAGVYGDLLSVSGRHGRADAWITITGPEAGAPAVFEADPGPCCNTIEISDSSYIVLSNLTIDGKKVGGAFGINASRGPVHHITVEGCTFTNHDAGQQTVAISTKVTTWSWIIRKNRIVGAGTGLYLGNSNGSQPFIGGLIENNLVSDTIGYNMEIKWQSGRTAQAGMPEQPTTTVIRNNVFIKNDRPSEDGDRPNVLVGGFPDTGLGSQDRYQIYGNFFFHNPRESLLQASGRVTIHDNVFVDGASAAIRLADHDLPLRLAHVYNNTIYGTQTGIGFSSSARQGDAVIGNLVFASTPISGSIQNQRDNLIDSVQNAAGYVKNPSLALGAMDFYPLAGRCEGPALDLSPFASDTDHDRDFNGATKGGFTFRGAYAGSGTNPGWKLGGDFKGGGASAVPDAGAGTGGSSGSAGTSGGSGGTSGGSAGRGGSSGGGGAGATAGSSRGSAGAGIAGMGAVSGASAAAPSETADEGCGCRVRRGGGSAWLAVLVALALARRRGTDR